MFRYINFRFILLLLFSVVLMAAEPNGCTQNEQAKHLGEWRWIKTSCCFRTPVISTPESIGLSKRLILNADSTFERYENDNITKKGTYHVRKGLNDYALSNGEMEPVIVFFDEGPAFYFFKNDTLVISKGYMDLQTDYFVPATKLK